MNNKDKDYDEFLAVWKKSKSNMSPQRQISVRPGRYSSPKHTNKKGRRNRQCKHIMISAFALALLILIIILLCKCCSGDNNEDAELAGVWYYDQYTEYEFDAKGNGCMCLDGNNHFEFTYKAKGGILYLDFALDYVTDCQYTYTVEGNKLTLVGGEGTAEVGKVYELSENSK